MSVIVKRSDKSSAIPPECTYGCCTEVYGKNVKRIRRQMKRTSKSQFRRDLRNGEL